MRLDVALAKIAERTSWQPGGYADARDLPRASLEKLLDKGYIVAGTSGWYCLSDDGRDAYEAARSRVKGDTPAFKDEALTGIREVKSEVSGFMVSARSKIKAAALPNGRTPRGARTPEDLYEDMEIGRQRRAALLRQLGCTGGEFAAWIKAGRIKHCKGTDEREGGHLGLFDFQRGRFLRHLCRNCINKKRRERNSLRKRLIKKLSEC